MISEVRYFSLERPCQGGGGGGVGPMSPVWILKLLLSVFINACRLLSALPSLSQFGRGRLSLVAISFYALSLLFGPCRLSEFTLAGPLSNFPAEIKETKIHLHLPYISLKIIVTYPKGWVLLNRRSHHECSLRFEWYYQSTCPEFI